MGPLKRLFRLKTKTAEDKQRIKDIEANQKKQKEAEKARQAAARKTSKESEKAGSAPGKNLYRSLSSGDQEEIRKRFLRKK